MTRTREQKQRSRELLEKKRADNRRFDADKKRRYREQRYGTTIAARERYWRAKSSDLSQIVKLYQDLPARIQEILVNHREDE